MDAFHNIDMDQQTWDYFKEKCMRWPCWCPFQEHQYGGQNKKVFGSAQFYSSWFGFAADHTKSIFTSIFHSTKHFNVHKFIDFCDQQDSHNYDNGQLLKNSNL